MRAKGRESRFRGGQSRGRGYEVRLFLRPVQQQVGDGRLGRW
jgi:hypothetical protein